MANKATVRVIDHEKKMSILDLNEESFEKLKSDADAAGLSLEDMALIHMTGSKTSRFKGTVLIEVH